MSTSLTVRVKIMSALSSFVLAIVLHPEVQVKAQRELDRVIGHARLPDFQDWGRLPYVHAIVNEVLRYVVYGAWKSS